MVRKPKSKLSKTLKKNLLYNNKKGLKKNRKQCRKLSDLIRKSIKYFKHNIERTNQKVTGSNIKNV